MAKGKYLDWISQEGLLLLEGYARDGLTDEEIADKMGIGTSTFYRWQNKYGELREAIKRGKAPVDYKVENALLKSATGYTVTIKKPIKLKEEKQKAGQGKIVTERIEYVDEEVYIPPQTTAQIFWLKNRRPEKWRDKPENFTADKDPVQVIVDV